MDDFHIAPMLLKVLRDQTAMTVMGFWLATEKASIIEKSSDRHFFNTALGY